MLGIGLARLEFNDEDARIFCYIHAEQNFHLQVRQICPVMHFEKNINDKYSSFSAQWDFCVDIFTIQVERSPVRPECNSTEARHPWCTGDVINLPLYTWSHDVSIKRRMPIAICMIHGSASQPHHNQAAPGTPSSPPHAVTFPKTSHPLVENIVANVRTEAGMLFLDMFSWSFWCNLQYAR